MREPRGQASIEWLGAVALLALVLGGVGTAFATGAAPGVVNAVTGQVRRALCLVGGGGDACAAVALRPCVVRSDGVHEAVSVTLAVIRVGADRLVLREERSDGTVAVTLVESGRLGGEVGLGVIARLRGGVGASAQAALVAKLGHGRMWLARDGAVADRMVAALRRHDPIDLTVGAAVRLGRDLVGGDDSGDAGQPDEKFVEGGANLLGRVDLAGVKALTGDLRAVLDGALGVRWATHGGRRTFYLRLTSDAVAQLGALSGLAMIGGTRDGQVALTVDGDGRPVQLALAGALGQSARLKLPGPARVALGVAGQAGRDGGRVEGELRLDLTRPAAAAAAARFLRVVRSRGARSDLPGATADLALRLTDDAEVDVRVVRTGVVSKEVGGGFGAAARLGASAGRDTTTGRLALAWTKPAGGVWERRVDCEAAAG